MQKLLSFFLLTLATLYTTLQAQSLTSAWWVGKVSESELPTGATFKGEFKSAVKWEESGGDCWLVVSEIQDDKMLKNDLYVYQYKKEGSGLKLVWDIRDFSQSLGNVHVVPFSLQVLDLDGDGLMETSFFYHFPSDGADPTEVKLMLHTKGQKLAIRGSVPVMEDEEVVKNVDPVVDDYPEVFRNFMDREWEAYVNDNDEEKYETWIKAHTEMYMLVMRWNSIASGSLHHVLWDRNGKVMDLRGDAEVRLWESEDVLPLNDGFRLVYNHLPKLEMFDLRYNSNSELMTFLPTTEAISNLVASPSGNKVAFFALGDYPKGTRLFVLTLDDNNTILNKQKLDLPTFRMAASSWIVGAPRFIDDSTIEYQHWTNPDDEEVMKRVTVE